MLRDFQKRRYLCLNYATKPLFWPIFDAFCGGSIRSLIQPPQNESKTRLKRTQKSTEAKLRKRSNILITKDLIQRSSFGDGFLLKKILFLIYTTCLKNWEFDKKASQNSDLERATIVRAQGASEDENFEKKPTQSKTHFSDTLCINGIWSPNMLKKLREYYQALIDKNSEYEGVFFVGVKTTDVFCRPTCPAKKPKIENCDFFPDAEQALLAGFRP